MKTAKEVKCDLKGFTTDAVLYQLSEPVEYNKNYETGEYQEKTSYVIVSSANVIFTGAETYIFPANKKGKVLDWEELSGSYRGGLNHNEALENAGYTIE